MNDGPLIVQSDKTLLLEVDHDGGRVPQGIAPFAELERAPEHVHTYRLTPLGLWNARAAGHDAEQVVDVLLRVEPLPGARTRCSSTSPRRWTGTAGCGSRRTREHGLVLRADRRPVLEEVLRAQQGAAAAGPAGRRRHRRWSHPSERGHLKQVLLKLGWPAEDLAGYVDGEAHPIELRSEDRLGPARLPARGGRGFWHGGSGVVVLPCGAGKTLVGAGAMARAKATTLILVTNTVCRTAVEGRAAHAHHADRGGDRRVLRASARRSGRSRSRRTRS